MALNNPAPDRALLLTCLRQALGESELVYGEICDVCALRDINAEKLASGVFDSAAVAEQLFLTDAEATRLLNVCKQEVNRANQHGNVRLSLAVSPIDEDQLTVQFSVTEGVASDPALEPAASPGSKKTPPPQLPAVIEDEEEALLLPVFDDSLPTFKAGLLTEVSDSGASALPQPSVPRYLRPTAASLQQTKKEREAAALREAKPVPKQASVRASYNSLRLSITLLEPTAASLARSSSLMSSSRAGDAQQPRGHRLSKSMGSQQLEAILSSPAGQRVTRPRAFRLAVDVRPKTTLVSTEDLQLAKAKEASFSPHKVPKHVHETRPLEFRAASSPKKPQEVFVPFKLASLERHTKQQEVLKQRAESIKTADAAARTFSALQWSKDMDGVETPTTPRKPEVQAVTVPQAFSFKSEERIAHYHAVIEPVKKAKEAEQNKEKLEEERKARELMDMSVDEFRKTLKFKARVLPDFSSPFQPSSSPVAPTQTQAFALKTTSRLGDARPLSAREDYQGHMGFGDEAFASSLRGPLRRSNVHPLSRSVNWSATQSQQLSRALLRQDLKASLAQGLNAAALAVATNKKKTLTSPSCAAAKRVGPNVSGSPQSSPRMVA